MIVRTAVMEDKLHKAMLSWQKRHFKDYPFLLERWSDHYKTDPFRLVAKLSPIKSDRIEVGDRKGEPRAGRTRDLDGETLERARGILRAQASTELGSIQQHRESLHKAQDPKLQFDVLRVMAEEFRHGYQMIYLLASDDWGGRVAHDTIDELLEMETGSHVLDAFNVPFDSFVDNIVFAAVIDRVGKYQLAMQRVFAYAPMAESMNPMLVEEAFHLTTGMAPLKKWVREAAAGEGFVSIASIQRHLNKWIPRGLDMFGDERGGETNVRLGLKDLPNGEAVLRYHRECREEVVDVLNVEIVRARQGRDIRREEALQIAERGDGEFLTVPPVNFFRRRGVHAYEDRGDLRSLLPEAYVSGRDFLDYLECMRSRPTS